MADELTPAELTRRVPASSWTASSSADDTRRWFEVLPFDEDRKALVLEASGRWLWASVDRSGASRSHELRPPEVVGVLPLLELDPAALQGKVTSAAAILGIPPADLISALPSAEVFAAAFETRSDYWIDRALEWMVRLPGLSIPAAAMRAIVDDPMASQSVRHRIRKLLSTRANA